jgi:chemotaxis signal transduction protein
VTTPHDTIDWNGVRERLAPLAMHGGDTASSDPARLREVFRRRAQQLARRSCREPIHAAKTAVIVFRLHEERFAIELSKVKQVFARVPLTPVPRTGEWLLGVANLNGAIHSVIDPAVLLHLPASRWDAGYVVLLRAGGKQLGMWVERLEGVSHVDLEGLTAVDAGTADSRGGLLRGTTDDHLFVLDEEALIECARERRQRNEPKNRPDLAAAQSGTEVVSSQGRRPRLSGQTKKGQKP